MNPVSRVQLKLGMDRNAGCGRESEGKKEQRNTLEVEERDRERAREKRRNWKREEKYTGSR